VATPVAIFGRDKKLSFYNQAYMNLWKLDQDWLDQHPSDGEILDRLKELAVLPPMADYRKWKRQLLECYQSEAEIEHMWALPDGRTVQVVAAQRPDGGVTYIYDDVSARLAMESRYDALIHVQRETIDSLKEGVAVFATDGRLRLFNSGLLSIWRLSRASMDVRPHIRDFVAQSQSMFPDMTVWDQISEVVTSISYQRESAQGQMIRADGSVIDFATTPLPDGGTLVTFADVTAARAYERTLVERNEALEAADTLKSQFIGHVSYELRTPLTAIMGFNEMMLQGTSGPLTSKQREYLGDISDSSRKLLSIVDNILDLTIIDAGGFELKPLRVAVPQIIEDALEDVKDPARRARLTLEIALEDKVEHIVADEAGLRKVLHNLLSNAVGFSKPGGTVRLSCWKEDATIAFSVQDNGVGIPKDRQGKVFDRFEANSYGSHHRGAGLGLSVVKSLVVLHGGQMELTSEPDQGTTVTVRLPEDGLRQRSTQEKRPRGRKKSARA